MAARVGLPFRGLDAFCSRHRGHEKRVPPVPSSPTSSLLLSGGLLGPS